MIYSMNKLEVGSLILSSLSVVISLTGKISVDKTSEVLGSTPKSLFMKKFKPFQIRWKEELGEIGRPYLIRWTLLLFNYSIRLHHWLRSDDDRFFHDHSSDFISIVLKGKYQNVTPEGTFNVKAGSIWFAKADQRHYLKISPEGAWTLLFFSRPYRKWGFWVNGHLWRPLRYFSRFGIKND